MTETLPEPKPLPIDRPHPLSVPQELLRLQRETPISRLTYADGTVGWLVTGHAQARSVLGDPRFSSRSDLRRAPIPVWAMGPQPIQPGFFITMDPPDHTRLRKLLTGQFTVKRIRAIEARIAEVAEEYLDEMERRGSPVDLLPVFAMPLPALVLCEILGVPFDERSRFTEYLTALVDITSSPEQVGIAYNMLGEYTHDLVRRKRSEPTDDMLSGLATSDSVTEQEAAGVAGLLLTAGFESTAYMIATGAYALLQKPDQLAALRADPALIEGAVEELLRYLTPLQAGPVRAALEDVEIDGHHIAAGEVVTVSLPTVNRDPQRFDSPETLDVHRSARGHMAFGHGVHQCLGQQLARCSLRVGYTALFRRFPTLRLAVPPEEVPMRREMPVYGVNALPVTW
ncbi:cytochrome P450 [Streptomyces phaeochromogenes]|uniref:cytochrome P450 n=1 Tax=Streptomyces phaeochromogenes TaxID=1923 RepID=UPI00369D6612